MSKWWLLLVIPVKIAEIFFLFYFFLDDILSYIFMTL